MSYMSCCAVSFLFWEEWTLVSAFHLQMIYLPQKIISCNKLVEVKVSLAYQLCPEQQFVIHYKSERDWKYMGSSLMFQLHYSAVTHGEYTKKKNMVGMRQCASNFSGMLISYSLSARNRSVEQAASAAHTSNFQYPGYSLCFSHCLCQIILEVQIFCQWTSWANVTFIRVSLKSNQTRPEPRRSVKLTRDQKLSMGWNS